MTPERQLELFEQMDRIEKSGRIADLNWKGINLWVLFRLELMQKLLGKDGGSTFSSHVPAQRLGWRERLSLRRKERAIHKALNRQVQAQSLEADLLLFTESDSYYGPHSTGQYNRHMDPFLEGSLDAGYSAIKLHAVGDPDRNYVHVPRVLFHDPKALQDYLWYASKLAASTAPVEAWRLGEELDVDVQRVMVSAAQVLALKELYLPLMQASKLKAVGLINYHNVHAMSLIEAARTCGIASFDIQHGKQGSLNFSYSGFAHAIPKLGSLLPSGHWNWNADSAHSIQHSTSLFRCAVGGNAWLNKNRTAPVAPCSPQEQTLLDRVTASETSILFCAQPQQDYVVHDFMEAFALNHPEVLLCIRLHPRQVGSSIKGLDTLAALPNVDVDLSTSIPLFALLKEVDVVATRWSTVALEARIFGKRAWITDPFGCKTFGAFVESGQMQAALTLNEWESRLHEAAPKPLPIGLAPQRTTAQWKDCLDFLVDQARANGIFDPDQAE